MPELGEIRRADEIGRLPKNGWIKHVWVACVDCGKERWVQLTGVKFVSGRCRSCARRGENSGRYGHCGERTSNWKGGRSLGKDGYLLIRNPLHPRAFSNGYIGRARLVLEQKLGRPLRAGSVPHHINGIRDDDRPENLQELSYSEHNALSSRTYWNKVRKG